MGTGYLRSGIQLRLSRLVVLLVLLVISLDTIPAANLPFGSPAPCKRWLLAALRGGESPKLRSRNVRVQDPSLVPDCPSGQKKRGRKKQQVSAAEKDGTSAVTSADASRGEHAAGSDDKAFHRGNDATAPEAGGRTEGVVGTTPSVVENAHMEVEAVPWRRDVRIDDCSIAVDDALDGARSGDRLYFCSSATTDAAHGPEGPGARFQWDGMAISRGELFIMGEETVCHCPARRRCRPAVLMQRPRRRRACSGGGFSTRARAACSRGCRVRSRRRRARHCSTRA